MSWFRKKKYHYLITVIETGTGKIGTVSGEVICNGTRFQVYLELFKDACKKIGVSDKNSATTFWSLEPNDL